MASFEIAGHSRALTRAQAALKKAHVALVNLRHNARREQSTDENGAAGRHASLNYHQKLIALASNEYAHVRQLVMKPNSTTVARLLDGLDKYERLLNKLATDLWRQRELRYIDNNRDIRRLAQLGIQTRIGNSLVLLVVICTAVFFTRRFILKPINRLATAASAVAAGDLEHTVDITSNDEIGHLQAAFNQMVHDLKIQHTELIERAQFLRTSREQLRNFAASLNAEIERERGRIAHAVHDDLGQNLAAMRMYLGGLHKHKSDDPRIAQAVGRIEEMIASSGVAMRRIIADLRPLVLDNFGIVTAAEALVKDYATSTSLEVDLDVDGGFDDLPTEQATVLYRMLQECFTNIVKHAHAAQVSVRLQRREDGVVLAVSDDGLGFSQDEQANTGAYGLSVPRACFARR